MSGTQCLPLSSSNGIDEAERREGRADDDRQVVRLSVVVGGMPEQEASPLVARADGVAEKQPVVGNEMEAA